MSISIQNDSITCSGITISESASLPLACVSNAQVVTSAAIARSKLAQDANEVYSIKTEEWRDATQYQTVLGTPATNKLGITTGVFGTAQPYLATGDVANITNASCAARTMFRLPPEYDDGESVTIRLYAGVGNTNTAATSCTIDAEAYEIDKDSITAVASADLVSSATQSINSATIAYKDFTVTPTNLAAGDLLDVRVTIASNDNQTSNAIIGVISHAEILLDIQG